MQRTDFQMKILVMILNSELEEIETIQGLSKFYLYVDKSSTFKVKSGQYGPEEKVTITVNTGGDEEIDEFMDTIVFPDTDTIGDQGKTIIISNDESEETTQDEDTATEES